MKYRHHDNAIAAYLESVKNDPEVVGALIIGSIARKEETVSSDIDMVTVVSDDRYAQLLKRGIICEVDTSMVNYDNGYLDLKYFTPRQLAIMAKKGSEPARYAFTDARLIYSKDDSLEQIIEKIPVFQESERREKLHSFYSAFTLAHSYYWKEGKNNPYLRLRAASDIALFGGRLLLQDSRMLFPSQKGLEKSPLSLPFNAEIIVDSLRRFVNDLTEESMQLFLNNVLDNLTGYEPPKEINKVITRHVMDNELWYLYNTPLIAEW